MALGREARRLREARDLTQEKLADRAGLHPNYIGRIERGESNVGVKALFKLANSVTVHLFRIPAGVLPACRRRQSQRPPMPGN